MAGLVGVILVAMAFFSVAGVLYMVMREHPETEEHYIPPPAGSPSEPRDHVESDEAKRPVEENS